MSNPFNSAVELVMPGKSEEYTEKVKANEMNPVRAVYESLLNLGVEETDDKKIRKFIRITNFGATTIFAASLLYLSMAI
jgi:hypothetical protein